MSTDRVADAVELLLRLSIFGFSQLSASDQLQKTEEVRNKLVHQGVLVLEQLPEESEEDLRVRTFTELFKKLPFHEHDLFLSKVIKKFKRERQFGELISWFSTQLDSNEQQEVIGKIVNVTADHEETNDEDARLGRFSQLSRDYTDYVHKLLVPCMDEHRKRRKDKPKTTEEETSSDWQSRFAEFYFGFSVVWFKGQSVSSQRRLIEHPNSGRSVIGTASLIIDQIHRGESEEDFRLRKFSELLCTKALPFGTQARLIDTVQRELRERTSLPCGTNLKTKVSSHAANEIISHLLTFGFSKLSATDQQRKIEEISGKDGRKVEIIERLAEESEEDFRMRTFTSQVYEDIFFTRADLLSEVTKKFLCERKLHDLTLLFRQLGSKGRQNLIEQLFDWLMETYYSSKYAKDVIIEKLSEESEEDFRLRRFVKLCTTHPSLWDRNEVAKWDLTSMLQTSGNREINNIKHDGVSVSHNNFSSRYAEFYFGLSIIWFNTRCTNEPRNPIQVLLGEAEEGDTIKKLRGENEEDFRLRRFIESFKQLQVSSQEYVVKYILNTLQDIMLVCFNCCKLVQNAEKAYVSTYRFEEDLPFALEFIKVKTPNLRGGGGGATAQGGGATAQGGGATAITQGKQGTSPQSGR